MRRISIALFSILLVLAFVSCSSGNPEPPADNKTQLEKADDAISSVSHVFSNVNAEIEHDGTAVYKIESPVQIDGMTVSHGEKKVSDDGFKTSVSMDISYEENGQEVNIKSQETIDVSVKNADGIDAADVSLEETDSVLAEAKQISMSEFVQTGQYEYTYNAPSPAALASRRASQAVSSVIITFEYETNKASYEYAVTYDREGKEYTVTESSSKQIDMKIGDSAVDISSDLRNEFSLSRIQDDSDAYFIVKFMVGGSSGEGSSQRVKEGDTVSAPALSAPEKYFLKGWYTDEALTEMYDFSSPVKESITLYAEWITYKGKELTMWSMWNSAEPQGQIIQQAAAAFEEETGAHVTIEFRGRDISTIINTALQGGEDIDIFEEDYTRIGQQYAPYCYDLEAMAQAAGYYDNCYPLFNTMTKEWSGGKLVSIPEQPNMGGIFYDKAKFEAAGITETPTTWAEFLDVCQKLVDAGFQPLALDATYADFNFGYHLNRYIGEAGTRELSLNGGWSQEPGVIAAAEDIIDFINRGYLAEGAPDAYPAGQNKIGFENVAMVVCADYVTSEVNNNTGANIEWGVFNYPEIAAENGGRGSRDAYAGAVALAVTSQCSDPQVAFDFIMFLTRGEYDQMRADQIPQIPADPANTCTSLDGAVDTLLEAEKALSWTMGVNANANENEKLNREIKNTIIRLFHGEFKSGEEFAATLDALY